MKLVSDSMDKIVPVVVFGLTILLICVLNDVKCNTDLPAHPKAKEWQSIW